jgi:hypothetical protein
VGAKLPRICVAADRVGGVVARRRRHEQSYDGAVACARDRDEVVVPSSNLTRLIEPRISIVICNYNYGRYLEQALRSALEQSYPCEVVVVDDGSTDASREILAAWADRITLVLQDNAGQCAAYNAGFARCTGDVVVFLDSDDYLEPFAAAHIAALFERDVAKVHFRLALVDERSRALGTSIPTKLAQGDLSGKLLRSGLLYSSAPGSGNAYRKSVLDRLFPLPLDPVDRHGADFFTIYGAALFGHVAAIEQVLGGYRVHAESGASEALVFGNAAQVVTAPARALSRVAPQFRAWISERTGGAIVPPRELGDFSLCKTLFVGRVFGTSYLRGIVEGSAELPKLLQTLWLSDTYSASFKLGLSGWALAVLVAPRPVGRPLARFVTNPASRGRGARSA